MLLVILQRFAEEHKDSQSYLFYRLLYNKKSTEYSALFMFSSNLNSL